MFWSSTTEASLNVFNQNAFEQPLPKGGYIREKRKRMGENPEKTNPERARVVLGGNVFCIALLGRSLRFIKVSKPLHATQ